MRAARALLCAALILPTLGPNAWAAGRANGASTHVETAGPCGVCALHFAEASVASLAPARGGPTAAAGAGGVHEGPALLAYWAAWGDDTAPMRDLKAHGGQIDWLVPYWYTLRADGSLKPREQEHAAVVRLAKAEGSRVLLLVNLARDASSRLEDAAFRARAAHSLARAVEREGADGVHIDFEGLPGYLRGAFTEFVAAVKSVSKERRRLVTVAVGPKWAADPSLNPAAAVYDYKALGRLCDAVVVMTYDFHTPGGAAGPVAPLPWVARIARYAATTMPREKVYLGLAGYGYDWSPRGDESVDSGRAAAIAARPESTERRDPLSVESEVRYSDAAGVPHILWMERAADVARRAGLARAYGLGGVALWSLGQEDRAFWDEVPRALGAGSDAGGR